MEAPGRVRGMRGQHEPRGQPHFVLPPNLYMGPPVGGLFGFKFSSTVAKGRAAAWSASRLQCRMEAPGRVRGMRGQHEPRGQPHFVLPPNLYMGPPVGGTFWFQIFVQASSPEIWSETISGGEEVLARKGGGLFLGYLLGKN